jgi:hypothetical protein
MNRIRQAFQHFGFAIILYAALTSPVLSGEAPQAVDTASPPAVQPTGKLDLSRLRATAAWNTQSMTAPGGSLPVQVRMQTGQGGWSSFSTAKKTWIIVGSVLGAGVVVAAVSNHGGGGGGGGY